MLNLHVVKMKKRFSKPQFTDLTEVGYLNSDIFSTTAIFYSFV